MNVLVSPSLSAVVRFEAAIAPTLMTVMCCWFKWSWSSTWLCKFPLTLPQDLTQKFSSCCTESHMRCHWKIQLFNRGWSKSLCAPDDYSTKNKNESKMAITGYIRNVDSAVLNTVFENTVRCVNKCLETGGGTLWILLVTFCIVIIRCTEDFWSSCIILGYGDWLSYGLRKTRGHIVLMLQQVVQILHLFKDDPPFTFFCFEENVHVQNVFSVVCSYMVTPNFTDKLGKNFWSLGKYGSCHGDWKGYLWQLSVWCIYLFVYWSVTIRLISEGYIMIIVANNICWADHVWIHSVSFYMCLLETRERHLWPSVH